MAKIDSDRFRDVTEKLRLHTPDGNETFRDALKRSEGNMEGVRLLKGLSFSNIKLMRQGKRDWPNTLPVAVISALYRSSGIDVSTQQALDFMANLGFDIRLDCGCAPNNKEPNRYRLEDLRFEIHEASAVADDPENDDFELELKIGFDRLRLTISGDTLKPYGNYFACETPDTPDAASASDDVGWFRMRLVTTDPLCWTFEPKQDGQLLANAVKVEGKLAEVTTAGGPPTAIITALREALKVRIVDPVERRTPKALIDEHRDRMCAAVARRAIAGAGHEYVLCTKRL